MQLDSNRNQIADCLALSFAILILQFPLCVLYVCFQNITKMQLKDNNHRIDEFNNQLHFISASP